MISYSILENTVRKIGEITGDAKLNLSDMQPAISFLLLWSIVERVNLPLEITSNNLKKIPDKDFSNESVSELFSFFKNTYFPGDNESSRFSKLILKGKEEEVRRIFMNNQASDTDKLEACLYVIYRFRNNFAHGRKVPVKVSKFLKEFSSINEFLEKYLVAKVATMNKLTFG